MIRRGCVNLSFALLARKAEVLLNTLNELINCRRISIALALTVLHCVFTMIPVPETAENV
jgi:hypothetical protein